MHFIDHERHHCWTKHSENQAIFNHLSRRNEFFLKRQGRQTLREAERCCAHSWVLCLWRGMIQTLRSNDTLSLGEPQLGSPEKTCMRLTQDLKGQRALVPAAPPLLIFNLLRRISNMKSI